MVCLNNYIIYNINVVCHYHAPGLSTTTQFNECLMSVHYLISPIYLVMLELYIVTMQSIIQHHYMHRSLLTEQLQSEVHNDYCLSLAQNWVQIS